jgi:hypothetical protein
VIPWPNAREVVCRKFHIYERHDDFLGDYLKHWRFAWQHEVEDAIERSPQTGMLQATSKFRSRMYDLRAYTFKSDFFETWPDFAGTANKFEPQLAVYRLHDRTREHERLMTRAATDENTRRLLQLYYDHIEHLRLLSRRVIDPT